MPRIFSSRGQGVALGPATAANTNTGITPMPALTTGVGSDGKPLSQRPLYDSTSHVLTWQGPIGGGASNGTYPGQSLTLTVVGGSVTSSGANTVIEGKAVTGNPCIQINHNNVTVRRCFAQITPFNTDESHCINIAAGVTGTIVEDCYLDGNSDSLEGNGITGDNFAVTGCTVRRNHFYRCGQAIHFTLNNISFTENYCHQVAGGDSDWFEVYPNGGVCNNLFVQYNYLTGPDDSVQGSDSGVNLSTGAGLPGGTIGPNVVIDTNWFVWNFPNTGAWQFHSLANGVGGATGGNPEILEFTFTNNGIFNSNGTPSGSGSILFGTASSGSSTSGGGLIHDSGNYVMGTTTARTGTLYAGVNGAGRM